jgi:hypothetical protein
MSLWKRMRKDGTVVWNWKIRFRQRTYQGYIGPVSEETARRVEAKQRRAIAEAYHREAQPPALPPRPAPDLPHLVASLQGRLPAEAQARLVSLAQEHGTVILTLSFTHGHLVSVDIREHFPRAGEVPPLSPPEPLMALQRQPLGPHTPYPRAKERRP